MINLNNKPIITKKRGRRKFSLEDKQELCEQWQASGLNKHQFCKQNDLVLTAFSKWCNKFLPENTDASKRNWIPVVSQNNPHKEEERTSVEIMLPNKMIIHVSLNLSYLKTLLQELCHANTVIRK